MGPFDYINIINFKSKKPENLEGYDNFIVNRNYSNILETTLYANNLNVDCDSLLNFDYYYYSLSKKKRYGKWYKKVKDKGSYLAVLNNIIEHYNCSKEKAQEIYDVLESNNLLNDFAEIVEKGGKYK